MTIHHEPVMTREVLAFLQPQRGGVFVDCTVGLGGHAKAMLDAGATKVIGLDRDPAALVIAAGTIAGFGDRVELVHSDYRAIESVLEARDGALDYHGVRPPLNELTPLREIRCAMSPVFFCGAQRRAGRALWRRQFRGGRHADRSGHR